MTSTTRRVTLVDDETGVLRELRRLLQATPCTCQWVTYRPAIERYVLPQEAPARPNARPSTCSSPTTACQAWTESRF